jgi:hypothetical protein
MKDLQRTIRIVDFELPRGAVTIEKLMAMPRATWEHLRAEINLRRDQDRSRPLARCRLCEGSVFVRSQAKRNEHIPMFAHFPESSKDCPWYDGGNLRPDDARAAQYQGHQESALHRRLCTTIEQLSKADPRCSHSAINTYLRSAIHKRGRWPDVYLEMDGLGRFALEVQLSKPFAPEIAARHVHYDREGISLIWVFRTLENPMPQGFHDVVTMQRGNAFVFDDVAEAASIRRGTLVLSCHMENGQGGWLEPELITLEDLQTGHGRSAFLEDRRSDLLETWCKAERSRWWKALQKARQNRPKSPFDSDAFSDAWDMLQSEVPGLADWEAEFWAERFDKARVHCTMLFAILCSVAHSAEAGTQIVHITKYSGEGAVLAMLNSKLSNADFRHCANLVETFIGSTALAELLERPSLKQSIGAARTMEIQINSEHPLWLGMARLFPEVLDGMTRGELSDLGRLPKWASGPSIQ